MAKFISSVLKQFYNDEEVERYLNFSKNFESELEQGKTVVVGPSSATTAGPRKSNAN